MMNSDPTSQPSSSFLSGYFYDEPGSIPGTLRIQRDAALPKLLLFDYNTNHLDHIELNTPEDCIPYLDSQSVSWVDVQGLGSEEVLQQLGTVFQLHPLALEDIVNVPQRPKVEDYPEQLVILAQMVLPKRGGLGFVAEQISLVLGKHYLLSVQEEPLVDCFNPVRARLQHSRGVIRHMGADYLAYALLDAIIDGYFPVLEDYGARIADLEDDMVLNPNQKSLANIYQIRRELTVLRRLIWSQRDALSSLLQGDNSLISESVDRYLRDCYDHTIQLLDITETYRDAAASLMEVYLSSVNNRMSEVMKTLTVISTIFIPLTFVVGVYGMNFNSEASPFNMPELEWYWGYPGVWVLMLSIAACLIYFFWRRGWFRRFS